ncbi:MAG: hypothetical protein HY709_09660 [Candidatus Latescibacteria bacterium]|nr:hypothetical protein [Candidatus Latescibacterota bacterium]
MPFIKRHRHCWALDDRDPVSPQQATIVRQFWQELGQIIPEWQRAIRREVTSAYLRQHYIHAHGVTLL